jgi:general secretion pathway protein F
MSLFEYRGTDRNGKSVRGSIDADSTRTARVRLKKDGIYIVEMKNKQKAENANIKRGNFSNKKVPINVLCMMTRQLAVLVRASVPLVESLGAVAEQTEEPVLKAALTDIRDQVNEGSQLYKALERYPKIFTNIYISMANAGEQSGSLDAILMRLAEFQEASNELNSKIRAAMIYPLIMMIFTLVMLAVIFVYVIPKITTIFEQSNMKLPWYSQAIIDLSGIMVNYWFIILIAGFGVGFSFVRWKNTPAGAEKWDAILLKLPVIGKLVRIVAVSRFTRTLATLRASDVPMPVAMDIVRNVVGNHVLMRAISEARDYIIEGENISGPLKRSGQFPPLVTHMIAIGEKTGELETMLTQVSDAYDFQVKTEVDGLTALLTPVMIVLMGGVIGVIVMAIMVPIFSMSQAQ